ncbi:hypothetical protein [Enterovirga sp. CN4-39]|uniref:hypothetical protein n=1 Tax=Enterovirga sp. CN4-39 TaxID=3400910 RepID=UPI003BFB92FD
MSEQISLKDGWIDNSSSGYGVYLRSEHIDLDNLRTLDEELADLAAIELDMAQLAAKRRTAEMRVEAARSAARLSPPASQNEG